MSIAVWIELLLAIAQLLSAASSICRELPVAAVEKNSLTHFCTGVHCPPTYGGKHEFTT